MPLAFRSLNRGVVAFGFFHIETDLLLLERRVFWCREFCELITDLAGTEPHKLFMARLPGWDVPPEELGDLHGAIAGVSHQGLIGKLYDRWPFPREQAAFRQKPAGAAPRDAVLEMVEGHAAPRQYEIHADPETSVLDLDGLQFDPDGVRALAEYVWRGGMPGWENGDRPDYLWEAGEAWRKAVCTFMTGLTLSPKDVGVNPG